jgi:hypothetical protein
MTIIIKKSNISFIHQALELISINTVKSIVEKYGADAKIKGYTTKTHVFTMNLAQLAGCDSIRDLVGTIATSPLRFQELFMDSIPTKSSISYANKHRDYRVFKEVFEETLKTIKKLLPNKANPFRFSMTFILWIRPL